MLMISWKEMLNNLLKSWQRNPIVCNEEDEDIVIIQVSYLKKSQYTGGSSYKKNLIIIFLKSKILCKL